MQGEKKSQFRYKNQCKITNFKHLDLWCESPEQACPLILGWEPKSDIRHMCHAENHENTSAVEENMIHKHARYFWK